MIYFNNTYNGICNKTSELKRMYLIKCVIDT